MTSTKIKYLRALIVDDSRISRTKLGEMLKTSGFKHLDGAENADDAAKKMEALRYDIVFLDWLMPGRSGISLLEQWREDRRYDDVAVIVVSTEGEPRLIDGALKTGALSYIVKPVVAAVLQEHLGAALKWLETRRKLKDQQGT